MYISGKPNSCHLNNYPPLYLNSHGTHIHILPIREEGINKIELLRLFSALNGPPTQPPLYSVETSLSSVRRFGRASLATRENLPGTLVGRILSPGSKSFSQPSTLAGRLFFLPTRGCPGSKIFFLNYRNPILDGSALR